MATPPGKSGRKAELIAPDSYPQLLSRPNSARALHTLRSRQALERAQAAADAAMPQMKRAILQHVAELEGAGPDMAKVYETVHEIRGFAENAGMSATGRISEVLCRYLDDMTRFARHPDPVIVSLHVRAIVRAAAAEDEDAAMGAVVAQELAALVARKLSDVKG